ncbi:MAG: ribosome small subunit-dependent GTPase A [Coprobacillus sp.]|nr:ribosome small subunit-dependent GTPase A [Coprobacillus sp.]
MTGLVVGQAPNIYYVKADEVIYRLSPRGLFKIHNLSVMVGDVVEFDENTLAIYEIHERKRVLRHPKVANIDQLVIVMSLKEPDFSYYLLCKYLTYANSQEIESQVILTKTDLVDSSLIKEVDEFLTTLNIKHYFISNKTGEGLETLHNLFSHHLNVLCGQSGVGKSSLLNSLDPTFEREIGEYSTSLNRGKHKTTSTMLLPFLDGYIADTPGFSSLELRLSEEELSHYFPGFYPGYLSCYYKNCRHISEPQCEIKKLINEGKIPSLVYDIYRKMKDEINEL